MRVLVPLLLLSAPSAFAEDTVGVVDVHRVMESTQHWKDAAGRLEKEKASRQVVLEAKQKELKDRKEKLDAQRAVAAPEALAGQEEELMRDVQMLSQQYMAAQQELLRLEKEVTEEMLMRIEAVTREAAAEADYAIIFEAGTKEAPNVLYVNAKVDLTEKVIKGYQQHFKDKPLRSLASKNEPGKK